MEKVKNFQRNYLESEKFFSIDFVNLHLGFGNFPFRKLREKFSLLGLGENLEKNFSLSR